MERNRVDADDLEARLLPQSNLDVDKDEPVQAPLSAVPELSYEQTDGRLASLDVFRGLTVVAMIVVDYGGGFWWGINHAPWSGITFADFVVPAFLFIVGVSLALSYKEVKSRSNATLKITLRFLMLFSLGLLLQGGYFHGLNDLSYGEDLQHIRIMGVLQRIAIAYVVVAFVEIFSPKKRVSDFSGSCLDIVKAFPLQWISTFIIICLYSGLLYGLYVPDWQFEAPVESSLLETLANFRASNISLLTVKCNVTGSVSPACNAVGFIDRSLLGTSHLYKHPAYRRTKACSVNSPYDGPLPEDAPTWCLAPFDPEGLLSSLPAIVTCFFGVHYGHILLLVKGRKKQFFHWSVTGAVFAFFGILLDSLGMPFNKQLYTLSYLFVTGGAVALAFVVVFMLVDVYKWKLLTFLFKFVGVHSLLIYALFGCGVLPLFLQGFYWKSPDNNLIQIFLNWLGF